MYKLEILDGYRSVDFSEDFETLEQALWDMSNRLKNTDINEDQMRLYKVIPFTVQVSIVVD